jgi:hypothetical protein
LNEFLKNYRTDQEQGQKSQEQEATISKLITLAAQQADCGTDHWVAEDDGAA